ncbi:MAG: orotate phosphoribosyltransferase [Methanosarcinales archaeon]|nr:orotate phosphoribosyltransferase [Methermicoccus shengliensis]KUK04951.1 MAG: Orotate phosphoribosyltransferase [Euryarchaeota archaeon 55_53]KUK30890.1 MAG: Orotate phosphoribosyltransferase [Methanosarcinales archeaon 56_1174]MDI3487649.1 orotate phosphoribosyltransferase [Methanosarcinales archaeon]MDN5294982.1 orotate phosphoribosyltransferase [Methanosarcinales archaeon]
MWDDDMEMRQRLLELVRAHTTHMSVVLSSGRSSNVYVDCRMITLHPEGALLSARALLGLLDATGWRADAIGGPTLGADPICGALAVVSQLQGRPIPTFIVRKERKAHGRGRQIEGPIPEGAQVVLVDDVATTGGSLLKAARALREEGHTVVGAMVLVDRGEGALEALEEEGIPLRSVFSLQDIV